MLLFAWNYAILHIRIAFQGEIYMKEIVVVGAGKIGATIADLLASTGEYAVTVVDRSQAQLDALNQAPKSRRKHLISKMPRPSKPL